MGSPQNIVGSASQLFYQDKTTLEYRALTIISTLPHPQRTLLNTFVTEARDREKAAETFLRETSKGGQHAIDAFLADWISVIEKVRPKVARDIDDSLERTLRRRDGDRCCILHTRDFEEGAGRLVPVYPLPPALFLDSGIDEQGSLYRIDSSVDERSRPYRILEAYLDDPQCSHLRAAMNCDVPDSNRHRTSQLLTLSTKAFEHVANGRMSLQLSAVRNSDGSVKYSLRLNDFLNKLERSMSFRSFPLDNRAPEDAAPLNQHLLAVHHQFAKPLAWLEVLHYMKQPMLSRPSETRSSWTPIRGALYAYMQWLLRPVYLVALAFWLHFPVLVRAYAYRSLASVGYRFYGGTGSNQTRRLPFNLYLRIMPRHWGPKHRAEFCALQLVKAHTRIPAPTPLDIIQYSGRSYLLMTAVPGEPIGHRLHTMTDAQVHEATRDLQQYMAELRSIPNKTGSGWAICNSLGAGILDWRIGDSQREELVFANEQEFTEYLTGQVNETTRQRAIELAPNTSHDIVFTHADLNMRNILSDETGKITGIVDWECAGWFPEYWEYSKAHFSVRYGIRWLADVIDRVFLGYREELWAENMLSDATGPF